MEEWLRIAPEIAGETNSTKACDRFDQLRDVRSSNSIMPLKILLEMMFTGE